MPLEAEVAEFTRAFLPSKPQVVRSGKVIHDALWGTDLFSAVEIAFLDTPLLQRLRYIHQTGFSFAVYPSCRHSRFEHTLGVMFQCSRFARELSSTPDSSGSAARQGRLLTSHDEGTLRLAALFHDVGHGLFSHCSENIYSLMPEMVQLQKRVPRLQGKKAHEVLSYLIITSEPFQSFFDYVVDGEYELGPIADLVLGVAPASQHYKADLLSSILDADKIDYIHRDARFSGLTLHVDLDRLRYATQVMSETIDGEVWKRLCVKYTGATPLEQILVSRFMLFPTLYHHHKIRACDCMFAGVVEFTRNEGQPLTLGRHDVTFRNPTDFLWGTDFEFMGVGMTVDKDSFLHSLIHDLVYRRLIQRVAVLSRRTIKNENLGSLIKYRGVETEQDHGKLRDAAREICRRANQGRNTRIVTPEQVWIDLPGGVQKGRDAEEARVQYPNDETVELAEVFPIEEWCELYETNRWQGHVFVPAGTQETMAPHVKDVLYSDFGVELADEAFKWCRVSPPR